MIFSKNWITLVYEDDIQNQIQILNSSMHNETRQLGSVKRPISLNK